MTDGEQSAVIYFSNKQKKPLLLALLWYTEIKKRWDKVMSMATYITFDDQSAEAIRFYEGIFGTTSQDLVTYGSLGMPGLDEKNQALVMNASLIVEDHKIMFSDTPSFMTAVPYGRNVGLVIELADADKLTRYFEGLSADGQNVMALQKTDWSELFGQATDKFGINWSFNLI